MPRAPHISGKGAGPAPIADLGLDDLDRRIVDLLIDDGRMSYAELARAAGAAEPTVRKRTLRLLDQGIITVGARLNPSAAGCTAHIMLGIRTEGGCIKEIGRRLAELPQVAYVGYLTGSYDILVEAFLRDTNELFRFLNEDLDAIQGILAMETWHVMRAEGVQSVWRREPSRELLR